MNPSSIQLQTEAWFWDPLISTWLESKPEADQKTAKESPQIALADDDKTVRVFRTVEELNQAGAQGSIKFRRISLKEFPTIAKTSVERAIPGAIFRMVKICLKFYQEEKLNRSSSAKPKDAMELEDDSDLKLLDETIDELAYLSTFHGKIKDDMVTLVAVVTMRDESGNSLIHRAVLSGCLKYVEALDQFLSRRPNCCTEPLVFFPNNNGDTPLHFAAEKGHVAIMNALVRSRYFQETEWMSAQNKQGRTPLHIAAERNDKDIVDLIKDLGCRVRESAYSRVWISTKLKDVTDNEGNLPVHLAAKLGHSELIPLIYRGFRNDQGETPLDTAIINANSKTVTAIMDVISENVPLLKNLFFPPNHVAGPLYYARQIDSKKDTKLEDLILGKVIVALCADTSYRVQLTLDTLDKFTFMFEVDLIEIKDSTTIYDSTIFDVLKCHMQHLFKYIDGCFRGTLERVRNKVEDGIRLINQSSDKDSAISIRLLLEEKESLSSVKCFLDGFVQDANARPLKEVILSLEASINSLQGTIKQNKALDETYYDPFITTTEVAMRKLAALGIRLQMEYFNDGRMIMQLFTELGSINKKAREQKALMSTDLVGAIKSCKDDIQKRELLTQLRGIKLKLFSNEEGEPVMKLWGPVKDFLMSKVQLEPKSVPSQQTQEDHEIELDDDLELQDKFNKWEKEDHRVSQALIVAVQYAWQGKFGNEIKDALEMGTLEKSKLLGLIVLDHILLQRKEPKSLIELFQPVQKPAKLSEQEEKQAYEKNNKLTDALNSLVVIIQKHMTQSAETPWNIEQIAQLLILPTEKDKPTEDEREALKSFNAVVSLFPIDAHTFNAINKFLIWPIIFPGNSTKYNIQLDAFRAEQINEMDESEV